MGAGVPEPQGTEAMRSLALIPNWDVADHVSLPGAR